MLPDAANRRMNVPDDAIAAPAVEPLPNLVQRELERRILAGIRRRQQVERGRDRRAPRRVARTRARGVPCARGIGARAAREEPRRVRAPDRRRGSRRDLRAARVLDDRGPQGGADDRATGTLRCAASSTDGPRRRARRHRRYHAANLEFHDRWWRSPATGSCWRRTGGSSTSCTSTAVPTLSRAGALPVSVREHHDILDKIAAGTRRVLAAVHDHALRSRRHASVAITTRRRPPRAGPPAQKR